MIHERQKSGMDATARAAGLALGAFLGLAVQAQDNDYKLGPDSQFNPAVPHGKVTKHTLLASTNSVFPGTVRDYWVYVPAQYDGSRPAALMRGAIAKPRSPTASSARCLPATAASARTPAWPFAWRSR